MIDIRKLLSLLHGYLLFILISIISFHTTFAADNDKNKVQINSSSGKSIEISSYELKKGERMFYGLINLSKKAPNCADCHYTQYIDTLNWNPSAFDIAASFSERPYEDLLEVVNNPGGKVMSEVHAGYEITEEQAKFLQGYLVELNKEGGPHKKPVINNLLIFILVNIIGMAVIADLLIFHKIPYKAIHLLIIIAATVYILRTLIIAGIEEGRQQGYAPAQPIKFSHKIHAGDNNIDCMYCHNIAEKSKSAGIPSASVCMNCHILIVEGANSGKFEISKIQDAMKDSDPIEWIKVHNLPDHVFFSHAQHVGAGKLDCAECHGDVENMDVLEQVNDLSMGWCLDCHRTRAVDFTENDYYKDYEKFHDQITSGEIDSITVEDIGGTNCMKCHY